MNRLRVPDSPSYQKVKEMKKIRLILAISIIGMMVSACAIGNSASENPLEGTSWVVTAINHNNLIDGSEVTITFEDGKAVGSGGCNSYSSSFQVDGEAISFDTIVQTEMCCVDILGIMDQENSFLAILSAAVGYDLTGDSLIIFSENYQSLTFIPLTHDTSVMETPSDDPSSVSQTNPNTGTEQTPSTATIEPPSGYKEYQDSQTGVSIYIPDDWYIQTQNIVADSYAIFSSYPPEKYIGGEARQAGDVKCDLNLDHDERSIDDLLQQWASSALTTIVSEEEILLNSGNPGRIFTIDSMGQSTTLVTEVHNRLVTLTCWGEFEDFKQIAVTLVGSEDY